jgi:hypothetical protein
LAVVLLAERLFYAGVGGVFADHPFDRRFEAGMLKAAGLDGPGFQQLVEVVPGIIAAAETSLV